MCFKDCPGFFCCRSTKFHYLIADGLHGKDDEKMRLGELGADTATAAAAAAC